VVWARRGGAERLVLRLLRSLQDDFDVALARVRPLPESERTLRWEGPTVGLRELLFGRWEIIHTHLFLPGLLVAFRRLWDGSFRWVHTVHYDRYASLRFGRLKRWLDYRFVFPAADALVSVSPAVDDALPPLPTTRLIPNAIPLDPRTPEGGSTGAREAKGKTLGGKRGGEERGVRRPVLGTVAMFRPEKGLPDLLEAMGALGEAYPGARLRIAGEGPLRENLERRIEELGLAHRVELCGFLDDLDPFYRSLDLYVQPSRQESFGLAVLDALRYRLPVVAAAAGHLPELLGEGRFGVLVPREGSSAPFASRLADALKGVIEEPERHRSRAEAGRTHWAQRLDPRRMVEAHRRLYRDVSRPRIAVLQPVVTHAGSGGIQRQLLLQTRELARRGHRIHLIQRRDPGLRGDPARRGEWRHANVLETPTLGGDRPGPFRLLERLRGLLFMGAGLVHLGRLRHRCDLVHAHQLYSPTLLAVLGKLVWGKPVVTKVTATGAYGELAELRRLPFFRLRKLLIRRVDRILVLTGRAAREVGELGVSHDRIERVPNSVRLPGRPARVPQEPGGPFRVLFVGRLSREKCLETLVDAARILGARGRRLSVDLVGGPDPHRDSTARIRERSEGLPRTVEVTLHGYREEVDPFYRKADAFVLPSRSEGMSNALLEAMAWGLPCVASNIPENREVLAGAGLLFRPGSAPELARGLEELIRDREAGDGEVSTALGRRARERIRRSYTVEAVVDRLEAIYAEVGRG